MIIEGLGNLTFVNGILRVQAIKIGPDGQPTESGTFEIPGTKVGDIINGLATAAQGISDKIGEVAEAEKNNDDKTSSNGEEKKTKSKKKK